MVRAQNDEKAFRKIAFNMRDLSVSESMNLTAQLIDDTVLVYWASLKCKYPSFSFEELIEKGHEELFINERRRDHKNL